MSPTTPINAATASARLRDAKVPTAIVDVARRLQQAGHAAVLVGGAVRDVLMGLAASDWDLASSATPDELIALFRRTIPTGVQHGTVTVLVREGTQTHPVEITTFRGEGLYVDGRRPESVHFLRDLSEDLARRDFTINALAWDPIAGDFSDPFEGLADLSAGVIRAVGVPLERFREDGLRTMRAIRFCATRDLRLESATEAAIPQALDVLAKVSGERVRVELVKLLGSDRPSLGLRPMWHTGIWPQVLLPLACDQDYEDAIAAVDRMAPEPMARLARLLWPRAHEVDSAVVINAAVEALRPSRADRTTVLTLTGEGTRALQRAGNSVELRKAAARLGREHLPGALELLGVDATRHDQVRVALEGAALRPGELAIKGRDLIEQGIVAKGPAVGRILAALLEDVLVDPTRNERATLLERARGHSAT